MLLGRPAGVASAGFFYIEAGIGAAVGPQVEAANRGGNGAFRCASAGSNLSCTQRYTASLDRAVAAGPIAHYQTAAAGPGAGINLYCTGAVGLKGQTGVGTRLGYHRTIKR